MKVHYNEDLFKATTEESGTVTIWFTAEAREKLGLEPFTPCVEVIPSWSDLTKDVPLEPVSF